MNILFTIMIMWVLVYNGLCPMGLALGYTIGISFCVVVAAIDKTIKDNKKEKMLEEEKFLKSIEPKLKEATEELEKMLDIKCHL